VLLWRAAVRTRLIRVVKADPRTRFAPQRLTEIIER
jgi:hypothetical protein